MTEYARAAYDPAETRRQYFAALARSLGGGVLERQEAIQARASEIFDANAHRIEDDLSRGHLRLTSLTLASYQILLPEFGDTARVIDALTSALQAPFAALTEGFRAWLDAIPNLLPEIAQGTKAHMDAQYGRTFAFEYEGDGENYFASNVTRCFYHSFFVANGVPELTPVFCAWDSLWTEAIVPARHGIRFDRPTTLGYGGDRCRFQFRKIAQMENEEPE